MMVKYYLLTLLTAMEFVELFAIEAKMCYQCNSAVDSDCEKSDADVLKKFLKKCEPSNETPQKYSKPIACRKIVQQVESSPLRVIRECAYTGKTQLDGMRKQGNKAIKMLYYQCENESNETPCNDGAINILSPASMIACGLLFALM